MQFKGIEIIRAESVIPAGPYCYTPVMAPCAENGYRYQVKHCRFHGVSEDLGGYRNRTCSYLKISDAECGTPLWDSVKACGVNYDMEDGE